MKIKYIKQQRPNDFTDNIFFTFGKEYEVVADYRNRQSGQQIADNGFVINDDFGRTQMVFSGYNGDFIITDNEIGNTFVFNY
jgi:hypothetical protein